MQDVLILWRQFKTVSTMKNLNKLSVGRIRHNFWSLQKILETGFPRGKIRYVPQWNRYKTSLNMTSDEVNKIPEDLNLIGCKVNQNITETNRSQFFSNHPQTIPKQETWLPLNLHWWFCRLGNSMIQNYIGRVPLAKVIFSTRVNIKKLARTYST